MKGLEGKVALVTGAGSGIGRATALLLAEQGVRVGVLSRNEDEVRQVVGDIKQGGGEALALQADISDQMSVRAAIERLVNAYGQLDIVLANAGINGVWAPIDELKLSEWEQTISVNLTGTFITIQESVARMREKGGSVIVTSSVNGTRMFSNSGATAYAVTKAGQVALVKMLALELADDRIRVNVICPGWIETAIDQNTDKRDLEEIGERVEYPDGTVPLTDGGPGRPEQVADLVLFLASDSSSHITGTEVFIDGGQSLLQG